MKKNYKHNTKLRKIKQILTLLIFIFVFCLFAKSVFFLCNSDTYAFMGMTYKTYQSFNFLFIFIGFAILFYFKKCEDNRKSFHKKSSILLIILVGLYTILYCINIYSDANIKNKEVDITAIKIPNKY